MLSPRNQDKSEQFLEQDFISRGKVCPRGIELGGSILRLYLHLSKSATPQNKNRERKQARSSKHGIVLLWSSTEPENLYMLSISRCLTLLPVQPPNWLTIANFCNLCLLWWSRASKVLRLRACGVRTICHLESILVAFVIVATHRAQIVSSLVDDSVQVGIFWPRTHRGWEGSLAANVVKTDSNMIGEGSPAGAWR